MIPTPIMTNFFLEEFSAFPSLRLYSWISCNNIESLNNCCCTACFGVKSQGTAATHQLIIALVEINILAVINLCQNVLCFALNTFSCLKYILMQQISVKKQLIKATVNLTRKRKRRKSNLLEISSLIQAWQWRKRRLDPIGWRFHVKMRRAWR